MYFDENVKYDISVNNVDGMTEISIPCSSDWEDWREDGGAQTVCLFCDHKSTLPQSTIDHMKVRVTVTQYVVTYRHETRRSPFFTDPKSTNFFKEMMSQFCLPLLGIGLNCCWECAVDNDH